jgi:hypothetical protein
MVDGAWTLRFAAHVNFFREFGAIKNSRESVKNKTRYAPRLDGQGR